MPEWSNWTNKSSQYKVWGLCEIANDLTFSLLIASSLEDLSKLMDEQKQLKFDLENRVTSVEDNVNNLTNHTGSSTGMTRHFSPVIQNEDSL